MIRGSTPDFSLKAYNGANRVRILAKLSFPVQAHGCISIPCVAGALTPKLASLSEAASEIYFSQSSQIKLLCFYYIPCFKKMPLIF